MARTRRTVRTVLKVADAQASRGVPTRAKPLAVKKSTTSRSISSTIMEDLTTNQNGDACYLQLWSRQLEWRLPSLAKKAKKRNSLPKVEDGGKELVENDEKEIASQENEAKDGVEMNQEEKMEVHEKNYKNGEAATEDYKKFDASIGDNKLKVENEDSTRKSTPCTLIVAVGSEIKTPTSSTVANTCGNAGNGMAVTMPSAEELEEFFTPLEKKNVERFIKKYNFDPVNDKPFPGRYEWVKLKP